MAHVPGLCIEFYEVLFLFHGCRIVDIASMQLVVVCGYRAVANCLWFTAQELYLVSDTTELCGS